MKETTTGKSWADQYKDPRWQKKRLEIMERDGFRCCDCDSDKDTLNVHHRHYIKGNLPWEYSSDALITLCEKCHKRRHKLTTDINKVVSYLGHETLESMHELIVGIDPEDGETLEDIILELCVSKSSIKVKNALSIINEINNLYINGYNDGAKSRKVQKQRPK